MVLLQTIKITCIGDSGVGKTQLIDRYFKKYYTVTNKTILIQLSTTMLKLNNGVLDTKCQVLDNPGNQNTMSSLKTHWQNAEGAMIVYDVANRKSFESVKKWVECFRSAQDSNKTYVLLVVGNKADLENRMVSEAEGQALAKNCGCMFVETSALADINVEESFTSIFTKCHSLQHLNKLRKTRSMSSINSDFSELHNSNDSSDSKSDEEKLPRSRTLSNPITKRKDSDLPSLSRSKTISEAPRTIRMRQYESMGSLTTTAPIRSHTPIMKLSTDTPRSRSSSGNYKVPPTIYENKPFVTSNLKPSKSKTRNKPQQSTWFKVGMFLDSIVPDWFDPDAEDDTEFENSSPTIHSNGLIPQLGKLLDSIIPEFEELSSVPKPTPRTSSLRPLRPPRTSSLLNEEVSRQNGFLMDKFLNDIIYPDPNVEETDYLDPNQYLSLAEASDSEENFISNFQDEVEKLSGQIGSANAKRDSGRVIDN